MGNLRIFLGHPWVNWSIFFIWWVVNNPKLPRVRFWIKFCLMGMKPNEQMVALERDRLFGPVTDFYLCDFESLWSVYWQIVILRYESARRDIYMIKHRRNEYINLDFIVTVPWFDLNAEKKYLIHKVYHIYPSFSVMNKNIWRFSKSLVNSLLSFIFFLRSKKLETNGDLVFPWFLQTKTFCMRFNFNIVDKSWCFDLVHFLIYLFSLQNINI